MGDGITEARSESESPFWNEQRLRGVISELVRRLELIERRTQYHVEASLADLRRDQFHAHSHAKKALERAKEVL